MIRLYGIVILAVLLGLGNQWGSNWIHNIFPFISKSYSLIALTVGSIVLFVVALSIAFSANWKGKLDEAKVGAYMTMIIFIGGMTSAWSLFVLVMSMG